MLRRTVRQRKEYLYRKGLEAKEQALTERKKRLVDAVSEGRAIPADLKHTGGQKLLSKIDLDDARTKELPTHVDDEYAYAGVSDAKVVLTTSRSPSSRLSQFAKEFRLLVPGCQRINRGGYVINDIVQLCISNNVTDLLILKEHRGEPDGLTICHLPHGPTAHFSMTDVTLRHDLPEKPKNMSEALPHLIFHNLTSKVGIRISNILKYLFPVPSPTSQRVLTFANIGDTIVFRHHTWAHVHKDKKQRIQDLTENAETNEPKEALSLCEVGPRFALRPYRIELGTVDMKNMEAEWALRPFFNQPGKTLA